MVKMMLVSAVATDMSKVTHLLFRLQIFANKCIASKVRPYQLEILNKAHLKKNTRVEYLLHNRLPLVDL